MLGGSTGRRAAWAVLLIASGCTTPPERAAPTRALTVTRRHDSSEQRGLLQLSAAVVVSRRGDVQPSDITALDVRLRNASSTPVQVRYDAVSVVEDDGRVLPVLPPRPANPQPARLYAITAPRFQCRGFAAAQYLATSYPTLPVWNGPFGHDEGIEDRAYARWPSGLPSDPIRRWAIPAGVLEPGGELEGRLYFPRLARSTQRILLQVRLHALDGFELTGEHRIVLDVTDR